MPSVTDLVAARNPEGFQRTGGLRRSGLAAGRRGRARGPGLRQRGPPSRLPHLFPPEDRQSSPGPRIPPAVHTEKRCQAGQGRPPPPPPRSGGLGLGTSAALGVPEEPVRGGERRDRPLLGNAVQPVPPPTPAGKSQLRNQRCAVLSHGTRDREARRPLSSKPEASAGGSRGESRGRRGAASRVSVLNAAGAPRLSAWARVSVLGLPASAFASVLRGSPAPPEVNGAEECVLSAPQPHRGAWGALPSALLCAPGEAGLLPCGQWGSLPQHRGHPATPSGRELAPVAAVAAVAAWLRDGRRGLGLVLGVPHPANTAAPPCAARVPAHSSLTGAAGAEAWFSC